MAPVALKHTYLNVGYVFDKKGFDSRVGNGTGNT